MFQKIVNAIKMVFEVLINLHLIFATKKDENQSGNTNVPEEDNKPTEAK
jgi:hypothetical protein